MECDEGETYGAGGALEDGDLVVALCEHVVEGAHEFELDGVGLVGVVEGGGGFFGVGVVVGHVDFFLLLFSGILVDGVCCEK